MQTNSSEPIETYRLTPMQEGMLFHSIAFPGSGIDVAQITGVLRESLAVPAFRKAWQRLTDRHEALRMRFLLDQEGHARQYPLANVTVAIEERDWSACEPAEQTRRWEDYLRTDRLRSFDPRVDLPTRVALFRFGPADYRFVWTWWHGILDGRSNVILLRELFAYYEAFRQGEDLDLPLPRRYTEYTEWLAGRETASSVHYWKELLAGFAEATPIGVEAPSATGPAAIFSWHEARLAKADSDRIRAAAEASGVTVNTFVQGAWALVLSRFSGRSDVVFGSTRACRYAAFDGDKSAHGIVGALINTVPVRVRMSPETRVRDLLQSLRSQHLAVRAYEHSPLVEVQAASEVPPGRRLFDSIVVYENGFLDAVLRADGGNWDSRRFDAHAQTGYRATAYVYGGPELLLGIANDPATLDDQSARRMLAYFKRALECIARDMDAPLSGLSLLPEEERRLLLEEWNRTERPFPRDATIAQLFAEQVARTPDAPALTCHGQTWTYRELDRRAEQIAACLRTHGARPEKLVAICMTRSLELVAGMLGILKSGAAYLPLDPAYPLDRHRVVLEDARPLLVLAGRDTRSRLPEDAKVVCVEDLSDVPETPAEPASGQHLAYVIYTSGSTGEPKGVLLEHRNVINFFTGMDALCGVKPGVWLAVASVAFDISVLELWWTLSRGFHVVLWPGIETAASIPALIRTHRVTHMESAPTFIRMLLLLPGASDALASLRFLILGGEPVPATLIRDLGPSPSRRLFVGYGPTEASVVSTAGPVEPGSAVTIGRPLANVRLFVLDEARRPVPIGVTGELYIGGAGAARGYLNRPDLTAEKFIADPFPGGAGGRLYRTGDLVRYRPDGTLEFAGRVDQQVKIRGHRVELEAIEATLAAHPGVCAAAVDLRARQDGESQLVAYIVPETAAPPSTRELREWIARRLPSYMAPAAFVRMQSLPYILNGKLDRKALPDPGPETEEIEAHHRQPTALEAEMLKLWCEILNRKYVGLDESFFDLGGDSLQAVRLLVAIERRFGVDLPSQVLFQAPVVSQLAEHVALALGQAQPVESPAPGSTLLPRTATERKLAAIWNPLLNIPEAGVRDNFFALGGNMQLFDRMMAEVRAAFGVFTEGLPVQTVVARPTIEALAHLIDENVRAATTSPVVCLQPLGNKTPLFLIHAGGGYVFFYRALASHLAPHRPVYAIRAESASDRLGHPYHRTRSVEQLAAEYVDKIRAIQPHGPYLLGGGCFGGVVAFEMARILRAGGEEVAPPLLFDSFVANNPNNTRAFPAACSRNSVWRRLNRHADRAVQQGGWNGVAYLLGKLRRRGLPRLRAGIRKLPKYLRKNGALVTDQLQWAAWRIYGRPLSAELIERHLASFLNVTARLLLAYTPLPYDGSIVLFAATEGDDPEPFWNGLARDGITVHRVPGGHLDMLDEPGVIETAALVEAHLESPSIVPELQSLGLSLTNSR